MSRSEKPHQRKLAVNISKSGLDDRTDRYQLGKQQTINTQQAMDLAVQHYSAGDLLEAEKFHVSAIAPFLV